MKNSRRSDGGAIEPSRDLIDEFKNAQTSILAVEYAKLKADHTEQKTLSGLHSLKSPDAAYLNPADIPEELKDLISYESLNAHFQKIQAAQAENHNLKKLDEANVELEAIYKGKKITARVIDKKIHPLAVGIKPKGSQREYYTASRSAKITGIITHINLAGNTITLKPTTTIRLFNSAIRSYKLFVINPGSQEPLITITLR